MYSIVYVDILKKENSEIHSIPSLKNGIADKMECVIGIANWTGSTMKIINYN